MHFPNVLTLSLGLIIFSFMITSLLVVPFINLLYKLRITKREEGKGAKKQSLFDKFHDIKAGTPTGGGILLILITTVLFAILFPVMARMGIYIQSAYPLGNELFVVFFTFISFGLLGLLDDLIKIFGKGKVGRFGMWIGMGRLPKFGLQFALAFFVAWWMYAKLGIHILHLPLIEGVINLGVWYIPFAAFVIIFFTNAFNFTDGLDGLASGLLMIYLFAYIILVLGVLDIPLFIFIAFWLGSIISFLYFNVYPARVFLGDAGALSFGAMIAVLGLLMGNVVALFVVGGIFVIEVVSSAIQILGWKVLNRGIFPIAPIHHAFLAKGWEEPKIVMRAWLAGIILAIFGLWLATI